ncbi:DUF4212 domain-containing protein [Shewanella marina]|uniref:DUF4212 domain-containing protein n=1 Tax=Shewanella marina TaxID=487319 RepID=UPI00046F4F6F|nr:DUF4212 domain-containing protein [Shewanella marina]
MAFENDDKAKDYWQENLKLVLILLSVWFFCSYVLGILLVEQLNQFKFMGFELGFWIAQQGAMYVFVALIFVYVHKSNALDKKYNVHED